MESSGNRTNGAQIERKICGFYGPQFWGTVEMPLEDMIRSNRRSVVEDCEIVNVTDTWERLKHSLPVGTVPTRGGGQRFCLLCPFCGRRAYKLYRPIVLQQFACRICHNLTYTSVQKHGARLYQLLKAPDCELLRVIDHHKASFIGVTK